jgi:hypothetical protein
VVLGWVNPDFYSNHRRFVLSELGLRLTSYRNQSAAQHLLITQNSPDFMHVLADDLLFAHAPALTDFKEIIPTLDHGTRAHQYRLAESMVVDSRHGDVGSSVASTIQEER